MGKKYKNSKKHIKDDNNVETKVIKTKVETEKKVILLRDVKLLGKKGSILPLKGLPNMPNNWYNTI